MDERGEVRVRARTVLLQLRKNLAVKIIHA